MKTRDITVLILVSLCLAATASADRILSKTEISTILGQVTDQPQKTWISAGTLQATHTEYHAPQTTDSAVINSEIQKAISTYQNDPARQLLTPELDKMQLDAIPFNVRYKLSNESKMTSNVIIKYDGDRFYWEINVVSRSDTVKPDAALAGNYMTDEFNLAWNQRRIFTWDGQKYTLWGSGGQAIEDTTGALPRAVQGPLTAGLVPWGYGKFKNADLSTAAISAKEVVLGSTTQVEMSITHADGSISDLSLDPAKAYATATAAFETLDNRVTTYTCSAYKLTGGKWVPWSISVEKRDRSTNKLLSSEQWTVTSISTTSPSLGSFAVPYTLDTIVENMSPVTTASSIYQYSPTVDTEDLLARRLAYALGEGRQPQNCATAALEYVAATFGKTVSARALAGLVGPDGRTTLYQMKQFAQGAGLYARAVRTDLAGLRNLDGVQAILHLPGTNHFVVLNEVDDRYICLTDLSSRNFFYRRSVDFFPLDWTEGTALLLSDRPIPNRFAELPDAALTSLVGSAYSCTKLFQPFTSSPCKQAPFPCDSSYVVYFERWVCESAASGTCPTSEMPRKTQSPCVREYDGAPCWPRGDWYWYNMIACN
jgi:predicted double-glycine peptidase